jgi:hypothetical protein
MLSMIHRMRNRRADFVSVIVRPALAGLAIAIIVLTERGSYPYSSAVGLLAGASWLFGGDLIRTRRDLSGRFIATVGQWTFSALLLIGLLTRSGLISFASLAGFAVCRVEWVLWTI